MLTKGFFVRNFSVGSPGKGNGKDDGGSEIRMSKRRERGEGGREKMGEERGEIYLQII